MTSSTHYIVAAATQIPPALPGSPLLLLSAATRDTTPKAGWKAGHPLPESKAFQPLFRGLQPQDACRHGSPTHTPLCRDLVCLPSSCSCCHPRPGPSLWATGAEPAKEPHQAVPLRVLPSLPIPLQPHLSVVGADLCWYKEWVMLVNLTIPRSLAPSSC